ncbi:MAG: type IV secretory system conjugative DNA transfer family protein [Actinomycetota bacterium]|nr:type IV secretory system conjugative DNA transfer family protein [Actinomycetota bacterium]
MTPTPQPRRAGPAPAGDRALTAVMAGVLGLAALVGLCGWLVAGIAGTLAGRPRPFLDLAEVPRLTGTLVADHLDLPSALHAIGASSAARAADCWLALSFVLAASVAVAAMAVGAARGARAVRRPSRSVRDNGARWARRSDLAPLLVASAPVGRIVVGRVAGRLIAVERNHSLLVAGPTQSGKTSGLAIPALLDWHGPAVAASVKSDLVRATSAARAARGRVFVYDPTGVSGVPGDTWSPLADAVSWAGARRVAAALCSVARAGGGLEDGAFWYATAEKLLAPLLHAAALAGASICDVVRWVDTEEIDEVDAILAMGAGDAPRRAFGASARRDERQRSSVYATTETILAAFADPLVLASASGSDIDPVSVVASGRSDTCYLVAPAHEQERLQPVFVTLLRSFLDAAFSESARRGAPLDPPLLVVLDEAANIAPLANLDAVAATAAAHGVQLVTLWQDLAQVQARYGPRAATVVNNHRAKLICSGVADPATLEHVRQLAGEQERWSESTSVDGEGRRSTTFSPSTAALAPADAIRRLPLGEAMLLYGHLPPVRLKLRPFYAERRFKSSARRASAGLGPAAAGARARGSPARPRVPTRHRRVGGSGGRC